MYVLSRWVLELSVMVLACTALLCALLIWPWSLIMAIGLIAWSIRSRNKHMTTLGSARFADEDDLRRAGMLGSRHGLILGRVPVSQNRLAVLWDLFRRRTRAQQACEQFLDLFRRNPSKLVRASQAIHTAVFAPTGVGKGVSCIIPFLKDCDESCVVVDFKGELAALTAEHRSRVFGHQIVLLDPYHVVSDSPDSFNPLDFIRAENPQGIDECRELAKALIVRNAEEKEPHWNDMAESWAAAMIATVVRHGEPGLQSLQTVRDLLSSPERIELAIKLMQESDAWEGMLARMGGQLSYLVDRERASTLTTVSRQLRFLDTPAIAASTRESSFDPAELLSGKMTIYLILPPEHIRSQSSLLRMWIGGMLRAVVRAGLRNTGNVHFVLDEAASLGHLEVIEDAVDKYRGYGIRLQFYYQSLGQLKKCFPNGQDHTLLSNTTQVFFGVNDTATADLVSSRLGEYTAIVESGGTSDGSSFTRSMGAQPQESSGYSSNNSRNWQQQARKLLKPEEVIALPPRVAITFSPGVAPIWSVLLRYYEEPWLGRRTSWLTRMGQASKTLGASVLVLLLSLAIAFVVCGAIFGLADAQATAVR